MKRAFLLYILLVGSTLMSAAPSFISDHFTMNEGLSNNAVYCSLKGKDGFLWFGTWYGLCRFDGNRFIIYNKKTAYHTDQVPRKVEMMAEDANGNIWIKTLDWKLSVFFKAEMKFVSLNNQIKKYARNIQIIKIQAQPDGSVLLLTKDKTLLRGTTNAQQQISLQKVVDANKHIHQPDVRLLTNVLQQTADHVGWVGMDYSITSINKKTKQKLAIPQNETLTAVSSIDTSEMWVGTKTGSVYKIDGTRMQVSHYKLGNAPVINLAMSAKGLYATLAGNGIFCLVNRKGAKWTKLAVTPPLKVSAGFVDKQSRLWLYHAASSQITCYSPTTNHSQRYTVQSSTEPHVPAFYDMGNHGVFFLTSAGILYQIADGKATPLRLQDDDAPERQILQLNMDRQGLLWVAYGDGGVFRLYFPQNHFKLVPLPGKFQGINGIRGLYQHKNGDVWVGARDKNMYVFGADGKHKFTFDFARFGIGSVYHFMRSSNAHLWLSTKGNGLVEAIPAPTAPGGYRFVHYMHNNANAWSISGNNVYATFEDSRHNIWVATLDGGLNLIKRKGNQIRFYNKNNVFSNYPKFGLYSEVRNMVEDQQHRLWVGTIDGLMSLSTQFDTPAHIRFETYQGMGTSSMVNNDVWALATDEQGKVWMSVFGMGVGKITAYNENQHRPVFRRLGNREGLPEGSVLSMVQDVRHNFWFVSEQGISYYLPKNNYVQIFDRYHGLPKVDIEEASILYHTNGWLWIGCHEGILMFNPQNLNQHPVSSPTYIVACTVNNVDCNYADNTTPPLIDKSITYTKQITLEHNQSMFTIEYAALNYISQNHLSYRYRLEGYDTDWHYNGNNRIASYTNVPPGTYTFVVESTDAGNPTAHSTRTLKVHILPPWWATWWAYALYFLVFMGALFAGYRLAAYLIRMRNNAYISDRLAELKIRFFTNISHELRTPLTLIQGSLQELKDVTTGSKQAKEYLELMEKNTLQMTDLVNRILDFRKIQNGKMRLHVSLFDIEDLMGTLREEFTLLAKKRSIVFNIKKADHKLTVCADAMRLGMVLRNILSNAFKFTPEHGFISINMQSICQQTGNEMVRIEIENSGSHIAEGMTQRIFERFTQGTQAVNGLQQGTGIGLALAHDLMELHHGCINAANTPEGVKFTVDIPTSPDVYQPDEVDFETTEQVSCTPDYDVHTEAQNDEEKEKPMLVIVDDNADLCKLLKMQLANDYRIVVAHNGKDGLEEIKKHRPDVVICDQLMPEMDGFELLKCMRADFNISHIPLIMLTAITDEQLQTKAVELGANAYIAKPFHRDYLKAVLTGMLEERRVFREHIMANQKFTAMQTDFVQHLEQADRQFVDSVRMVIETNLADSDFRIDDIAMQVGLSRSAFFKKIKSLTGLSPVDFVKEYRLNKAVELMTTGNYSLNQIAFMTGFSDSSYFGKCFKKKFGVSPRAYYAELKDSAK